jgi:AraC-like DNA-binding protein
MKVYPFKIPKPLSENLFVQVDQGYLFYDKLHQHEEIQIALIVKGEGKILVADTVHSYQPGNIFVIGGNCPHLFQSMEIKKDSSFMISIFFTKQSFGDDFFDIVQLEQIRGFFEKSDAGFKLIKRRRSVEKIMLQMPQSDKISKFLLFFKLLKKLCNSDSEILSNYVYPKTISSNDGHRIQSIFDYTMSHFQDDITLDKIASLACMTPNAFCHFFKQRTNKTFFQFLIELRVAHACQLIIKDHDLTMADISSKSGFKSISNFNRKFKQLKGSTPSQYFQRQNVLGV